jgi:GYF domain 2
MRNSNNDIEELEELLTELEGQEAQIVTPYSEEDDAVTRLMDAPLGDQDWMVQVTALDRRMMSTTQLLSELQMGKVNGRTLVWRGGMDDWMPVSRIDELSRASGPQLSFPSVGAQSSMGAQSSGAQSSMNAPSRNSSPRPSTARAAFSNLAPPPPAPVQSSQPRWSSAPSAPLPPPPSAMSPPFGMAPGMGLPPPPMALVPPPPPPIALTPPPPPPSQSFGLSSSTPSLPEPPYSQGNTTRPVAVDFSDMSIERDPPLQSKRWVMVLSAVAILAVFVTVYSLSSGGGESEAKATASAARPQAVSALTSAPSSVPKQKPAPAPAAVAKVQAPTAVATAKPSEDDDSESEAASASERQTAQARYTPRSEYRRRSRGGTSSESGSRSEGAEPQEESTPAPARAAAAPSSTARATEEEEPRTEPVAAVAEEVDEAPKSTSKSSSNTFNREAAKSALDDAAAQAKNCRPQGGPSGTGRVQVRYEPSGKVANVAILTSKFDNTTAGSCVRMLFRRAKVPEFTGAPVVVVNKSFEIP